LSRKQKITQQKREQKLKGISSLNQWSTFLKTSGSCSPDTAASHIPVSGYSTKTKTWLTGSSGQRRKSLSCIRSIAARTMGIGWPKNRTYRLCAAVQCQLLHRNNN